MENPTLEKLICDESFLDYCLKSHREEDDYWPQWIAANPQHRELVKEAELMVELLRSSPTKLEVTAERNRLQSIIGGGKLPVKNLLSYRWIGYAAACLLILSLSIFLYKRKQMSSDITIQSEFVQQNVPMGRYMNVLLADHTQVKLGPKSILEYPKQFSGKERKVKLNGEAYFKVSHNENKPFVIQTGDLSIKVLGTSFNVHAFAEDEVSKVALFTGKVEIASGAMNQQIKPGQAIIYDRRKGTFTVEEFDLVKEKDNMDGILHFEQASYVEIAKQLNRKYGLAYQERADIQLVYSGTIAHEPLEQVLEKLTLTTPYHFSVKSNKLIVRKK